MRVMARMGLGVAEVRSLREVGVRRIRWEEALWCAEERDGGDERDKEAIDKIQVQQTQSSRIDSIRLRIDSMK